MLKGKDLYYPGELVSLDDDTARAWIAEGYATLAICTECGTMLEPKEYGCPECGNKKDESIV